MNKQIIKSDKLKEQYTKFIHPTGLTVILYPMAGYSSAYALFGTRYGSVDTTFRINDEKEYITVPDGIAHFLEHKLFENQEGDAFSLFAKTGASANAYTSFDRTCYLFSCADNFKKSLEILLSFVQEPYFTKETVEKEQGIIGQEIRMYEDNPNWRVFFNLLQAMYVNNPVNRDIAGTIESIAQIDEKLLYDCYNTFYNLHNMVLTVAGNFDVDVVLEVLESTLKPCEEIKIDSKQFDEPLTVAQPEIVQQLEVAVPLFSIGFKEVAQEGLALVKAHIETEILLDIITGEGSKLYRHLYDTGLINATFASEALTGRGFFASVFEGESREPRKVQELLIAEFEEYRKTGISGEEFERAKKAMYGQNVKSFNNVQSVASALLNSYFTDSTMYDAIDCVSNVVLKDLNERLSTSFDKSRVSISIIEPMA